MRIVFPSPSARRPPKGANKTVININKTLIVENALIKNPAIVRYYTAGQLEKPFMNRWNS
jgi:hypothetical protein